MSDDVDELAALAGAARDGDRAAFDELVRRTHAGTYTLALRLTANEEDARDVTQEAYLRAYRGLRNYRGDAQFTTWLYRITTNACFDELRRRRRRPTDPLPELEQAPDPRAERSPDVAGSVADRLDVDAALASLSPEFRAPVVLRDLCQLDYAEIAEVLDIPPGTVRSRIARGRAALAASIAAGNQEHPTARPTPRP